MARLAPDSIVLYYCPVCGKRVEGAYEIEPGRKDCTKRIHRAVAKPVRFKRDE